MGLWWTSDGRTSTRNGSWSVTQCGYWGEPFGRNAFEVAQMCSGSKERKKEQKEKKKKKWRWRGRGGGGEREIKNKSK